MILIKPQGDFISLAVLRIALGCPFEVRLSQAPIMSMSDKGIFNV